MALQSVPSYIGVSGFNTPVEVDRNFIKAVYGHTGVLSAMAFYVTPSVTSRVINVAPGAACLIGVEDTLQGGYFAYSDSSASDAITLGSPSGSPRIDTLILRVVDTQYGFDPGSPRAELAVYQGTPASSPIALDDTFFNIGGINYKPGAWMRLADVRTNPGDTTVPVANITNTAVFLADIHLWARQ